MLKVEFMHQTVQESATGTPEDARTTRFEPVNNARELFESSEVVAPCVQYTYTDIDTAAKHGRLSNTIRVATSTAAWRE